MSTALQLVNDNKRRRIEAWLEALEWAKTMVTRLNGTPTRSSYKANSSPRSKLLAGSGNVVETPNSYPPH